MAIRIDAAADYLGRTTSLPSSTNFTLTGWSRLVVAQAGGTLQPVFSWVNGSGTDAITFYWDSSISAGNMRINCAVGGVETSGTNFASRPQAGDEFSWYVKCSGTGAGLLEAGWRLPTSNTWIVATATLSGALAALTDFRIGNLLGLFYLDSRHWNIKCWDTILSGVELLRESQYEPLVRQAQTNFYWPLPYVGDSFDRGGRFRNATKGGTLTTEPVLTKLQKFPQKLRVLYVTQTVTGTLAKTNANDTLVASGTTTLTGTLAKTNTNDTSSAVGTTTVVGTIAKTNNNDSLSSSGTTTVVGSLTYTNINDSLSASGSVGSAITGTLAYTNNNDALSSAGTTTIIATLVKTNTNDSLSSQGNVGILGSLAYTNKNDSISATGFPGEASLRTWNKLTITERIGL